MEKIMFDSNAFDLLPNDMEKIKKSTLTQYEYYVTTIQIDELCEIPDSKKEKRKLNILVLADLRATIVPIHVWVLNGMARIGYMAYGDGIAYEKLLNKEKSNIADAAIADAAVCENCILVTNDLRLHKAMRQNDYRCMVYSEFIDSIN